MLKPMIFGALLGLLADFFCVQCVYLVVGDQRVHEMWLWEEKG